MRHMPTISTMLACSVLACSAAFLQGCVVAAVGAGVAGGALVAADRRTTGTMVDDEVIEFKALDVFAKDKELWEQSHVNVTSYNNIVLLTGETPSETLRTRAAQLIRNIPKVRGVHNEIVIAAPSSMLTRSSDSWITGKVKSNLLASKEIRANRIKVVTENGTVYLMGLVTQNEANIATNLARQTGGVQRVVKVMEYLD